MTPAETTRRSNRIPEIAAGIVLAGALVYGLLVPPDAVQGDLQRLMYVHVPAAWLAYLAFAVTLMGSIGYLVTRRLHWDRLAVGSAEVGVFFTGLAILLGMVWGKPVWGVWWTWDARLTLTAIMFFVYLGYLALRRSITDPETRARRSAILGVLGVVQIPIVHFSVIWWRGLHQPPTVIRPDGVQIEGQLLAALLISLAAFTLVYAFLVRARMRLAALEEEIHEAASSVERPIAGDAVRAPTLASTPLGGETRE